MRYMFLYDESLSDRLVSSNRLEEPGIELGTPGYKAGGLSTYSNTTEIYYFQEVFLQKFQDKSRVK